MGKNKIIALLVIIPSLLVVSGCSISFKGSSKTQDDTKNGGIFKTENKGEVWKQKILVPTSSGQPLTIAGLNGNSLAVDPSDHKAIYFGSIGNGLFYTYDSAENWNQISALGNATVLDLAVDPKYKCVIYAAVGNKVLKSEDCSRNWAQVYFDTDTKITINSISIVRNADGPARMYVGTSRGEIIKSENNGESWQTLYRFGSDVAKLIIDPNDYNTIMVATKKKGIFRTNDGGANWKDLTDSLKEFKDARSFIDFTYVKATKNLVYMATKGGLLKSEDNGDTWKDLDLLPPDSKTSINSIAVNPQDGKEIYYVTNSAFVRSLDGGATWTTKMLPTTRAGVKLLIDPEDPKTIFMIVKSLKK